MTSKFLFRLLLLFTASYLAMPQARAQPCDYEDQNLFVLDIHKPGETKQAKNVEIYLVSQRETLHLPCLILPGHADLETNSTSIRIQRNPDRGSSFPGVGDYYVALINNDWSDLKHLPIYHAMVVYKGDSTLYRLPCEQSLNICKNYAGLIAKDSDMTMVMHNGKPFKPIEIVVGEKPPLPSISYPLEESLFQEVASYKFRPEDTSYVLHPLLTLDSVFVLDYQTLQIHQVVYPRDYIDTSVKIAWTSVTELDVFQDNPKGIYDLVLEGKQLNPKNYYQNTTYRQFYLYDSINQSFNYSPVLSEYPDIVQSRKSKRWMRKQFEDLDSLAIHSIYALEGGEWQRVKCDTIFRTRRQARPQLEIAEPRILKANCLTMPFGNHISRPVVECSLSAKDGILVRDSFIIVNMCDTPLILKKTDNYNTGLDVPKKLGSGASAHIHFRDSLNIDSGTITQVQLGGTISTSLKQNLQINYDFFLASAGTAIRDSATKKVVRYVERTFNNFTQMVVEVDENQYATSFGHQLIKSNKKVGEWQEVIRDGSLGSTHVYSKGLDIMITNSDFDVASSKPEILIDGIWMVPEFLRSDNGFFIYVEDGTDSCRVKTPEKVGSRAIDYNSMSNSNLVELLMLDYQQETINLPYGKEPIYYLEHQYAIVWNHHKLKDKYGTNYVNYAAELQRKYPKARIQSVPNWATHYKMDLSAMSIKERIATLRELSSLDPIAFISQIVIVGDGSITFAPPYLYINCKPGKSLAEMQSIASKYGITDLQLVEGNYFRGSHSAKVLDRATYQNINALSFHKPVRYVSVFFYYSYSSTVLAGNPFTIFDEMEE